MYYEENDILRPVRIGEPRSIFHPLIRIWFDHLGRWIHVYVTEESPAPQHVSARVDLNNLNAVVCLKKLGRDSKAMLWIQLPIIIHRGSDLPQAEYLTKAREISLLAV